MQVGSNKVFFSPHVYIYINKSKGNFNLEYGDIIKIEGEMKELSNVRNYKGFNEKQYGKSINNYGSLKASNIILIEKERNISKIFFNIRNSIKEKVNLILPKETGEILLGILIGEKSDISKEAMKDFRKSNLIHLLCVSGAHVVYIEMGLKWCISKLSRKKKVTEICSIIGLFIFMSITRIFGINCKGMYNGNSNINSKTFFKTTRYSKFNLLIFINIAFIKSILFVRFRIDSLICRYYWYNSF